MEVVLRRHAATLANLRKAYLGRTDEPLSPEGRAMALKIGPDDAVLRVYTSALRRTRETAALLWPKAAQVPIKGLDEMDFGAFEGKNWQDLQDDEAYTRWVEGGCLAACPGGEDRASFIKRCTEAFLGILAEEERRGAPMLHAVVHGGTLMAVLSRLALPQKDYFDWATPPCGGFRLASTGERERPLRLIENLAGFGPLKGPERD